MIKKIFLLFVCLGVSQDLWALSIAEPLCLDVRICEIKECQTDNCNNLGILCYGECCPNRERNKDGYSVLKQCPTGYYKSLNGCESCEPEIIGRCAYETGGISYAQICEQCPNRVLNKNGKCVLKQCPAERPARASDGRCHSCDLLDGFRVADEKDCLACPNRQMLNGKCVLKQCPDEKPLTGGDGCLACDVPVWTEDSKEICNKCPNRRFIEKGEVIYEGVGDLKGWTRRASHSGCYLKEFYSHEEFQPLFYVQLDKSIFCKDERCYVNFDEGNPPHCFGFSQYDCEHRQNFYSCDAKDSISTLPEVCARCPNREYIGGMCIRKYCSDGFEDLYGKCHACATEYNVETTKEECQKCPDRRHSMKRCCMKNEVVGFWEVGSTPECISCREKDFYTIRSECELCPNRIYQDGKCIVGCPLGYKLNEYKKCVRKWYNFFDWLKVFR